MISHSLLNINVHIELPWHHSSTKTKRKKAKILHVEFVCFVLIFWWSLTLHTSYWLNCLSHWRYLEERKTLVGFLGRISHFSKANSQEHLFSHFWPNSAKILLRHCWELCTDYFSCNSLFIPSYHFETSKEKCKSNENHKLKYLGRQKLSNAIKKGCNGHWHLFFLEKEMGQSG